MIRRTFSIHTHKFIVRKGLEFEHSRNAMQIYYYIFFLNYQVKSSISAIKFPFKNYRGVAKWFNAQVFDTCIFIREFKSHRPCYVPLAQFGRVLDF